MGTGWLLSVSHVFGGGEKYTVKIEYDADVFQTEDDKKISHPVGTGTKIVMAVMLLVVPGILLLLIIRAYKKANRWILTERRADLAMRLLISERAAITQAAEVVVAVPAHVRVPVPEAGEPDARKRFYGTKLTTMAIREALKDTAHEEI